MLHNRLLPLQHATIQELCSVVMRSKSSSASNVSRQSKILGKLFGNRLAGSKKRWYPSQDTTSNSGYQPPSVVFQASQFSKSNAPGAKHNIRRMSVLNKLFMTHITDLLATGEAAASITGRGLQVSRVKITADFSCINVYWLGGGELLADAALETELKRCSGQLRHELSQLRLMGEVPRIQFVRDKTGSNINAVEGILSSLDLSAPGEADDQEVGFDVAQTARLEFYGKAGAAMPEMRHDVLGLDHRLIMDKILAKMRKSKQAWEQHDQQQLEDTGAHARLELERMQRKLTEAAATADEFGAFLAKRHERKQTPERKRYRREYDNCTTDAGPDCDEVELLSPEQRQRWTQEDYILEEDKSRGPQ